MRRLVITQNITLDSRIEMLGDWFDPAGKPGVDNSDLMAESHRQDAEADALLVGRQTFEDFRGYWRDLEDDTTGVSDYLNTVAKYVVSSTLTEPDWAGTTVLGNDAVTEVTGLKNAPGRDIVCTGSITLTHALIQAGLVDEYRLFSYPTVQGRGKRLFPEGFERPELTLLDVKAFTSGVVLLRYSS